MPATVKKPEPEKLYRCRPDQKDYIDFCLRDQNCNHNAIKYYLTLDIYPQETVTAFSSW